MTKPTELPEWASSPQDPNDIVPPSAGRKLSGWHRNAGVPEKPPYQFFNWWQNKVYQWISWFDSLLDQGVKTTDSPSFINATVAGTLLGKRSTIYSSNYSSLDDAISVLNSSGKRVLILDSNATLYSNATFPSSAVLIVCGGTVQGGPASLIFNGKLIGGNDCVFSGSTVVTGDFCGSYVSPSWFSSNDADATNAVQYVFDTFYKIGFTEEYNVSSVSLRGGGKIVNFNGFALNGCIGSYTTTRSCLVLQCHHSKLINAAIRTDISKYACALQILPISPGVGSQYLSIEGLSVYGARIGILNGVFPGQTTIDAPSSENSVVNYTTRAVYSCVVSNQPNGFICFIDAMLDANAYDQVVQPSYDPDNQNCVTNIIGSVRFVGGEFVLANIQAGVMITGAVAMSSVFVECATHFMRLSGTDTALLSNCELFINTDLFDFFAISDNSAITLSISGGRILRAVGVASYSDIYLIQSGSNCASSLVSISGMTITDFSFVKLFDGTAKTCVASVFLKYEGFSFSLADQQFLSDKPMVGAFGAVAYYDSSGAVMCVSDVVNDSGVLGVLLPAGSYDIEITGEYHFADSTVSSISLFFGTISGDNSTGLVLRKNSVSAGLLTGTMNAVPLVIHTPVFRIDLAVATTIYAKSKAIFSAGGVTADASIRVTTVF